MVSKAEGGRRVSVEQRLALTAISISLLLLFSLWLSAAAIGPRLEAEWGLSTAQVGGLTMAVMVGFVVGSVGLIITGWPDLLPTRAMFAIATVVALSANAALVLLGPGQYRWAVVLRFLTGVGLAGGYPTAIKAVAGWFRDTLGSAAGVLIGALTVGAATPFLVAGMDLAWEQVVLASSGLAALGALIMVVLVGDGPYDPPPVRFSWHDLRQLFGNRRVRLISLAYFGHNWELFGLWTWIGVFLAASARSGGYPGAWTSPVAFAAVAIGALGAWLAGLWSDRYGRIRIARLALVVSGGAALLSPLVFGAQPVVVTFLFVVWGFSVVADSPLFSVMTTEAADETKRGTALTLQLAVGFLVPLITIGMVPALAEAWGWRYAFLILAVGPIIAIAALTRLEKIDPRADPRSDAQGHQQVAGRRRSARRDR